MSEEGKLKKYFQVVDGGTVLGRAYFPEEGIAPPDDPDFLHAHTALSFAQTVAAKEIESDVPNPLYSLAGRDSTVVEFEAPGVNPDYMKNKGYQEVKSWPVDVTFE